MPGPSARPAADFPPPRVEGRDDLPVLALDFAEVGLWVFDPATGALFWPARVKAMFGLSPDVPVTIADFNAGVHLEDLAAPLPKSRPTATASPSATTGRYPARRRAWACNCSARSAR